MEECTTILVWSAHCVATAFLDQRYGLDCWWDPTCLDSWLGGWLARDDEVPVENDDWAIAIGLLIIGSGEAFRERCSLEVVFDCTRSGKMLGMLYRRKSKLKHMACSC